MAGDLLEVEMSFLLMGMRWSNGYDIHPAVGITTNASLGLDPADAPSVYKFSIGCDGRLSA